MDRPPIRLQDRLVGAAQNRNHPVTIGKLSQWDLFSRTENGSMVHGREIEDRSNARLGLEERHPLYDRRLVEFALALPEDRRQRQTLGKVVLRNAMRGLLPESIRTRTSKANFSHVFSGSIANPRWGAKF